MNIVVIYRFAGRYSGGAAYDYNHPELGATHKCMLFYVQQSESDEYQSAEAECKKYGFTNVVFSGCGALRAEVLNSDAYRGFAGFYEEALSTGSALVYYPN